MLFLNIQCLSNWLIICTFIISPYFVVLYSCIFALPYSLLLVCTRVFIFYIYILFLVFCIIYLYIYIIVSANRSCISNFVIDLIDLFLSSFDKMIINLYKFINFPSFCMIHILIFVDFYIRCIYLRILCTLIVLYFGVIFIRFCVWKVCWESMLISEFRRWFSLEGGYVFRYRGCV